MTGRVDRRRLTRRTLATATLGLAIPRVRRTAALQRDVDAIVAAMTPRELAARRFMLPVSGVSLGSADAARLRTLRPGGVILVGDNFGTPDDVRELVSDIHSTNPELSPLVALDQEGGIVSRISDDPAPDAPTMGTFPAAEISALARLRAERLAAYGCDVNFAPVADVAFTPDSFMSGRAFGSEAEQVAAAVAAYLEGVAGTGVLHCVKHFPGHGRVAVDSHAALPVLDVDPALWWEEDALPFRVAVDLGVPMVMLGHLQVPGWDSLPASLSPAAVRVLRQELGFPGVVVSDDLGMGALGAWTAREIVDLAVAAGVDLLVFVVLSQQPEALVDHLATRIERDESALAEARASVSRIVRMQLAR